LRFACVVNKSGRFADHTLGAAENREIGGVPEVVAHEIKVEQHTPAATAAKDAYEATAADGHAPVAVAVELHADHLLHCGCRYC
jgi:hypothetical protein